MIIETERLILRPFELNDYKDVFEYLEYPEPNCFISMKLNSLEDALNEMKNRINETENYFAIVLKEENKVIGEIEVYPEIDPHSPYIDEKPDTYSPCWMLNKKYHHKGYAFEAVSQIFDYLFNEKESRRIYIFTEDYNIPCQHLCEKLGMRKEGLFKEFISFIKNEDGTKKYENTYQYAILKSEWKKQ